MPHLPHSALTLYILQRQKHESNPDFTLFLHDWNLLSATERSEYLAKSDSICMQYYQALNPAATATNLNDRVKLVKEIILKHAEPKMQPFSIAQQALVDALPSQKHAEHSLEEYFEAVTTYVNQLGTFKGSE